MQRAGGGGGRERVSSRPASKQNSKDSRSIGKTTEANRDKAEESFRISFIGEGGRAGEVGRMAPTYFKGAPAPGAPHLKE